MMGYMQDIFDRLTGRISARGTITTPSGDEDFPVAVCNEIMGGPFIVNTLDELKGIPVERLLKGCKCTVNEHQEGDTVEVTRTYLLKTLPAEKLSDIPDVDISLYWIQDKSIQKEESAIQSQYSGDYQGKKPPFLSSVITTDAYNAGYGSTADYESGDTSLKIWADSYDAIEHKWVRQRTGQLADWGIPVLVDDGYEEGTYTDVRFQWVPNVSGMPPRPNSMLNGESNNLPVGWLDTPDVPQGEDYETYILTNSLWQISGTKGVYGGLLSEWTEPIKVSTDPLLVRYGIDAENTDYLNDTYWRPYYTAGDKFKASRTTQAASWIVERITGESGEYIDYVFKEFEDSYEPLPEDAPTTTLGYGINGWKDGVFTAQAGYTVYVSTSRKFSDGSLSEAWTTPARYDGKSTIRAVVVPEGNVGSTFKYSYESGAQAVVPTEIVLEAQLFEANARIEVSEFTKVEWYRGTPETGTLIPKLPVGTEPSRNPQYSADESKLTIFPENVTGNQEFSARVYFKGEDYIDPISVVDVTDGIGYQVIIDSPTGFMFKGTETKTCTAKLYENGVDISASAGVSYAWTLGGNDKGTAQSVTVDDTEVTGLEDLKVDVTVLGNTYSRVESVTDVSDGKSFERQYSSNEIIDPAHTPDTPGNPAGFSTDATGAIWAIERLEGEDWGQSYRIKGEKGDPNGSFQKTVYRTRAYGDTPSWLTQPPVANTSPGDTLVPVDWSETPEASAPTGSEIYASKATFAKNPATDEVTEFVANWIITGTGWSAPFKLTAFPPAGSNGDPGVDGYNGWSPKLVVVSDGDRRVHQLIEWVNGTGSKPAGEGFYLGSSGLVSVIGDASDIRGSIGLTGPQGEDGVFNSSDYWQYTIDQNYYFSGDRTVYINLKLSKAGVVYYTIHSQSYSSSDHTSWNVSGLGDTFKPVDWLVSTNFQFALPTSVDDSSGTSEDYANMGGSQFVMTPNNDGFSLKIPFKDNRKYVAVGSYLTSAAFQ